MTFIFTWCAANYKKKCLILEDVEIQVGRSKFGILETSEFCQLHLNIFIYTLIKDNNCGNIFQKIAYVYIVLHKTIGGLKGLISRFIWTFMSVLNKL